MDVLIQCWVHRLIYALQGTPTASIDLVAPLPESKSLLSNNYVVYPGANPNPEEITLHFSNAVVNQVILKLLRLVMIVVSVALSWRVLEMVKGVRLSLFIVTQEDLRPAFEVGDLVVMYSPHNSDPTPPTFELAIWFCFNTLANIKIVSCCSADWYIDNSSTGVLKQ